MTSESDVVYQELQLNATFDRFDLVTGVVVFPGGRVRQPRHGRAELRSARHERVSAPQAANGNGVGRRQRPERLVRRPSSPTACRIRESIGAFANVTWHITDRSISRPVCATRSTRKTWRKRGSPPTTSCRSAARRRHRSPPADDWDNTDWRLTLDYAITDNHMLYVTSSEAFRSGAYSYNIAATSSGDTQTPAIAAGTSPAFTPPEQVRNDEIGARTEWLDGRLRLNLTYFDMAYTNRQGADPISPTRRLPTGFRIELRQHRRRGFERLRARRADRGDRQLHRSISPRASSTRKSSTCARTTATSCSRARSRTAIRSADAGRSRLERGATLTFGLSYAYTGAAADAPRRHHDPVLRPPHGRAQLARAAACSIRVTCCPATVC